MTNQDRELLELAAKAANVCLHPNVTHSYGNWGCDTTCTTCKKDPADARWYPLTDDGDEAKLEAILSLSVSWHGDFVCVSTPACDHFFEDYDKHDGDRQKARRRAGVRAAAEIGSRSHDK